VAVSGWYETSKLLLEDFIADYLAKGVRQILCTDISKDGMLAGTATVLYSSLQAKFPKMHLIASGGVSGLHDIEELDAAGIASVVVGKAIYEGRIKPEELKKYA